MGERKITIITYDCPGCGSSIQIDENQKSATCEYCGTHFTIEREKEPEPKAERVYGTVEDRPRTTPPPQIYKIVVIIVVFFVAMTLLPLILGLIFAIPRAFMGTRMTTTVETKLTEADPFKNVQVRMTGMEPYGEIIDVENGTEIRGIRYHVDNKSGLSNGDVITIEAEEMNGYEWTSSSYEYTISGLDQLVTNPSQLSQEDCNQIYEEAKKEIEKDWENNLSGSDRTKESLQLTVEPYKMYLNVVKDFNYYANKNVVYPAFETTIVEGGKTYTFYQYAEIDSVYHSPDGALHGDFHTISASHGYIYTGEYSFGDNFTIWGFDSVRKMESDMENENFKLVK